MRKSKSEIKTRFTHGSRTLSRQQSTQTLEPNGLKAGIRSFNLGDYWKAHELWEHVWLQLPQPEKIWLQGLIQSAAVFHLLERGRYSAAQRLSVNALSKLDGWPSRRKSSPLRIRITGLKPLLRKLSRISQMDGEPETFKALLAAAYRLRATA